MQPDTTSIFEKKICYPKNFPTNLFSTHRLFNWQSTPYSGDIYKEHSPLLANILSFMQSLIKIALPRITLKNYCILLGLLRFLLSFIFKVAKFHMKSFYLLFFTYEKWILLSSGAIYYKIYSRHARDFFCAGHQSEVTSIKNVHRYHLSSKNAFLIGVIYKKNVIDVTWMWCYV